MSAGKKRLYLLPFLQNIQIYRETLTSYLKIFVLRIHELLQGQMHPRMSVTVSANAQWARVVLHMLAMLVQMHCGVWEINLCHLCFVLLSVLAECEGSMATIEVFSLMWHSGLQWCLACPPSFGQHPFQQRSSQTPSVELGVLWPWAGANISHR